MADESSEQPSYLTSPQAGSVIAAETRLIGVPPQEASALAISGGGIRSASFALGVVQSLVNAGVMPHVHYLSTVSGGGYLGSSLTWFLREGLPEGLPAGTQPEDFPFGTRSSSRVGPGAGRNRILDYIRQHADYLVPSGALSFSSFVAVVLRAMLVSLVVYFSLLTAVMAAMVHLRLFDDAVPSALGMPMAPNVLLLAAVGVVGLFAVCSLCFAIATRVAGDAAYALRTRVQSVFGRMLEVAVACALLGALPPLHHWVGEWIMATAGASSTFLGALMGLLEYRRQQREQAPRGPGALAKLRPTLAAMLVLYGLALGAFCLATTFTNGHDEHWELALQLVVAGAVVVGLLSNINYIGLHRMYRDRLMELFMPDRATVQKGRWALASQADAASIDGFCRRDGQAVLPYHLINTNVVLVDSPTAGYRGRGGDNFILSPLYCGSTATGWRDSAQFMKRAKAGGGFTGRGMTLPTAMAISGAALNPNSGVAGAGATRSRVVSTLLSMLNLRLGYWAPHPRREPGRRRAVPNFLDPGLRGGVLAGGLREDAPMIELSDGGHFENLAAYELIRRRVGFIFLCDGGQDGDFTFGDLANLTERVRVDFGAKISFDVPGFGLEGVRPGSAAEDAQAAIAVDQLAARGFAVGRIRYAGDPADAPSGMLFYFKGTMTAGLSTDLYGYRNDNPDFPHQSTGDQFFDERQFEAYRELGYHLGWQWIEANEAQRFWTPPAPSAPPAARVDASADRSASVV